MRFSQKTAACFWATFVGVAALTAAFLIVRARRQTVRLENGLRLRRLTLADMAAGDVPAALTAARRAAALLPDNPDTVGLEGMLENQAGHPSAALAALRRACALRPGDRDYLIPMIQLEMESEDFPDARRQLTPWLERHPQDAWACHLMAVILERGQNTPDSLQEARTLEQRARAGLPGDLRVYITLGQLDLTVGKMAEARKVYQDGLRLEPASLAMLHGLVTCDTRLGRSGEAAAAAARLEAVTALLQQIAHLQEVLRRNPADIAAGLRLARLEEQDGNLAGAQAAFLQTVRRSPHDPRSRASLVGFYRRHGRPRLAHQAEDPAFLP